MSPLPALGRVLATKGKVGSFAVHKELRYTDLRLHVSSEVGGVFDLPLSPSDLECLASACVQAPFDDLHHHHHNPPSASLEIDGGRFWLQRGTTALDFLSQARYAAGELGVPAGLLRYVVLRPMKLVFSRSGGYVRRPCEDSGFAIFVVHLPSMYSGGQVVVSHDGRSKTFVWERDASGSSSLQYSAFYSDCDYEVLPVKGGNRVTLVYQMALAPPEPAATVGSASSVLGDELSAASATDSLLDEHFPEMRAAVEAMRQWNDDLSHTAPRHIIFPLHNKYTREDISFESLVGQDRYTHHIALELQQQTKCLLMLVNFTLVLTTNDESPDLVVERHLELHQWVYSPLSKLILKHATTHLPALELTSLWPPDYYKRRTPDVCELFDNDTGIPHRKLYHSAALVLAPASCILPLFQDEDASIQLAQQWLHPLLHQAPDLHRASFALPDRVGVDDHERHYLLAKHPPHSASLDNNNPTIHRRTSNPFSHESSPPTSSSPPFAAHQEQHQHGFTFQLQHYSPRSPEPDDAAELLDDENLITSLVHGLVRLYNHAALTLPIVDLIVSLADVRSTIAVELAKFLVESAFYQGFTVACALIARLPQLQHLRLDLDYLLEHCCSRQSSLCSEGDKSNAIARGIDLLQEAQTSPFALKFIERVLKTLSEYQTESLLSLHSQSRVLSLALKWRHRGLLKYLLLTCGCALDPVSDESFFTALGGAYRNVDGAWGADLVPPYTTLLDRLGRLPCAATSPSSDATSNVVRRHNKPFSVCLPSLLKGLLGISDDTVSPDKIQRHVSPLGSPSGTPPFASSPATSPPPPTSASSPHRSSSLHSNSDPDLLPKDDSFYQLARSTYDLLLQQCASSISSLPSVALLLLRAATLLSAIKPAPARDAAQPQTPSITTTTTTTTTRTDDGVAIVATTVTTSVSQPPTRANAAEPENPVLQHPLMTALLPTLAPAACLIYRTPLVRKLGVGQLLLDLALKAYLERANFASVTEVERELEHFDRVEPKGSLTERVIEHTVNVLSSADVHELLELLHSLWREGALSRRRSNDNPSSNTTTTTTIITKVAPTWMHSTTSSSTSGTQAAGYSLEPPQQPPAPRLTLLASHIANHGERRGLSQATLDLARTINDEIRQYSLSHEQYPKQQQQQYHHPAAAELAATADTADKRKRKASSQRTPRSSKRHRPSE